MKIQCFIFSWRGQYHNACATEKALRDAGQDVLVINSDPDNTPDHWVNIGDSAYFTQQWLAACERFDADILFHVQADATYHNWPDLFAQAQQDFDKLNWGIYAPNVDYTWYDSNRSDVLGVQVNIPGLRLVSNPDCTCWFLHRDIIDQFRSLSWDWSFHQLGWGVDLLVCGYSYLLKRPIIRNYNHTVSHPQGTKYNSGLAEQEMIELFHRCDPAMQRVILAIRNNKEALVEYLK
jgi:hypothetical protein